MKKCLLLGLVLASGLGAQALPPGRALAVTPPVAKMLDSMAKKSNATRSEQLMCVSGFAVVDSTLIIGQLERAANVIKSDSLAVYVNENVQTCEWWQPTIHSHLLAIASPSPSGIDYHRSAARGMWGLLLLVSPDGTWKLRAYP